MGPHGSWWLDQHDHLVIHESRELGIVLDTALTHSHAESILGQLLLLRKYFLNHKTSLHPNCLPSQAQSPSHQDYCQQQGAYSNEDLPGPLPQQSGGRVNDKPDLVTTCLTDTVSAFSCPQNKCQTLLPASIRQCGIGCPFTSPASFRATGTLLLQFYPGASVFSPQKWQWHQEWLPGSREMWQMELWCGVNHEWWCHYWKPYQRGFFVFIPSILRKIYICWKTVRIVQSSHILHTQSARFLYYLPSVGHMCHNQLTNIDTALLTTVTLHLDFFSF